MCLSFLAAKSADLDRRWYIGGLFWSTNLTPLRVNFVPPPLLGKYEPSMCQQLESHSISAYLSLGWTVSAVILMILTVFPTHTLHTGILSVTYCRRRILRQSLVDAFFNKRVVWSGWIVTAGVNSRGIFSVWTCRVNLTGTDWNQWKLILTGWTESLAANTSSRPAWFMVLLWVVACWWRHAAACRTWFVVFRARLRFGARQRGNTTELMCEVNVCVCVCACVCVCVCVINNNWCFLLNLSPDPSLIYFFSF